MYNSKNDLKSKDINPEEEHCCEDPSIKYDSFNKVCMNCGTILGQIYAENERRAYTSEEINKRKQVEPSWRDFGPRTILPRTKIDSRGQILSPKKGSMFSRLSKIQQSLINSTERNFWEAKPKLNLLSSRLNIPNYINETAWRIYIEIAKKKLTMGRSIDAFIAASLYAAIRIHDSPKLLDEISKISLVPNHTFFRSLGIIIKDILPSLNLHYHPISIEKLLFLIANKLELPIEIQVKALDLLKRLSKTKILFIGKDPRGLVAAILYLMIKNTEFRKTQSEIVKVANITEVTLRNRVKDIELYLKRWK